MRALHRFVNLCVHTKSASRFFSTFFCCVFSNVSSYFHNNFQKFVPLPILIVFPPNGCFKLNQIYYYFVIFFHGILSLFPLIPEVWKQMSQKRMQLVLHSRPPRPKLFAESTSPTNAQQIDCWLCRQKQMQKQNTKTNLETKTWSLQSRPLRSSLSVSEIELELGLHRSCANHFKYWCK